MSKAIHNPAIAQVNDIDNATSEFVVEPVHAGYGNTLGNSLRRVLLSSIRGAAFVSFRIEGVTHEFTTVPGVKEDVVDIMLNIKSIRLIAHTDNPVEMRLEKKGAGVVTAGDIAKNADIEVVNPEQVIATIDDPKGSLVIDFVAETGRGYRSIEESTEARLHSDHVVLDAMFSPVLRVRYKVEGTRVGRDTNFERLALTVQTDGSITPRDAFEEAAAILVNQYTALAGATTVEALSAVGQEFADDSKELSVSVEDLNLSARTTNALINNEIFTVHDIVTLSEQDLSELRGFGSKALDEVKDKLEELGL